MTWTVLHDACEHQDTKTMIARSKCNADEAHNLDDHGSTPLHIACWNNPPLDAVRALMGAHPQGLASKDVHGDTPLHIAVSNPATSVELVRALVEECPEATNIVNREGLMPLHSACRYSPMNDEIISIILEANVPAAKHRIKVSAHAI
jgi:ankyrin repeat protein